MARVPTAAPAQRLTPHLVPRLQASSTRAERLARAKAAPGGPFSTLTWQQQRAAEQWLWKFTQRWGSDLPPWRRAILIGFTRFVALAVSIAYRLLWYPTGAKSLKIGAVANQRAKE